MMYMLMYACEFLHFYISISERSVVSIYIV